MTPPAREVAPWVAPYVPDFRDLLRQLNRVPGFIFQPVVLPSPDLARALADWLETQGVVVRVFDMRREPWDELAARLLAVTFDPQVDRRAVVVITPIELDRDVVRDGLLALNSVRDTLARTLQCPLLWCGGVELLRTTATFATDLWSIAGTVVRVPYKDAGDVPAHWAFPRSWWTGAAAEDIERLEATFEEQKARRHSLGIVQAGLKLAEALLVHGMRDDASRILHEISGLVLGETPALFTRWALLRDAAIIAASSGNEILHSLREQAQAARRLGAIHEAVKIQTILGTLLRDVDLQGALAAWLDARDLSISAGDDYARLMLDLQLIFTREALPPGVEHEIVEHAESILNNEGDPRILGARLILAEVYRRHQRLSEADRLAALVLDALDDQEVMDRILALDVRARIAAARNDWGAVIDHHRASLDLARRMQLPDVEYSAHRHIADALAHLRHWNEALESLATAAALRVPGDTQTREAEFTLSLASQALRLGLSQVGIALVAKSAALHATIAPVDPVDRWAPPRALLVRHQGARLADVLDSLRAWQSEFGDAPDSSTAQRRLHELSRQLQTLADEHDQTLRAERVTLLDPSTWPVDASQADEPGAP